MRRKIVAGNWKMNTTLQTSEQLVRSVLAMLPEDLTVEKILFPPFPFLKDISELVKDRDYLCTGAQNCSEYEQGAYTGEVSAAMIKSVGGSYVLTGHSERRTYFQENDVQLSLKIKQALAQGLRIIFCFGEQLADRKKKRTL